MTTTTTSSSPLALTPRPARDSFWTRIAAELAESIARGVYPPGERLPSEHALAEQFGVNRHTIRRSLASLSSQGLLRVTQGSGTYVEEFAVELVLAKRTRHHQSMALAGVRGGLRVLGSGTVRATAAQARALQVPVRSVLLRLQVLGEAEQQPLHVGERFFPLPRFAQFEAVVRETGSITAAFAAHGVADYTRHESRITAQMPEPEVAAQLRQPAARPVLLVESVNVDTEAQPIEFARTWFAGDRVTLTVTHDE
ncbi:phosphonate metabolism transcriptional regulator PhnF [Variovorax guangxiensis]|uniref:phosphonate metabolism transcriptional regulator PhnF n=1 Tax=Variovorax guangxiensis TaxID=1775474 RepID=UPI002866E462|nr:phosphonate metabolism transcriptional regulator PhnF [Variovorax guangxiensis]MDR6854215.1 GntR family phosphonate transport system transcriptional regulator [Variovorax guangxiensis]